MAARTTSGDHHPGVPGALDGLGRDLLLHPVDGLSHRRHISFQDGNVGLKFGHEDVGLLGRQVRVIL